MKTHQLNVKILNMIIISMLKHLSLVKSFKFSASNSSVMKKQFHSFDYEILDIYFLGKS